MGIKKICTKNQIILIFDEIYTGWGKTGEFFYFMKYKKSFVPDILTMSKNLLEVASLLFHVFQLLKRFSKKLWQKIQESTIHSTTYNAFGEESLTALEAVNIVVEDEYPKKAKNIGKNIKDKLILLKQKYPNFIKEIRGEGCLQGIIFNSGPKVLNNLISYIPIELTKDDRFLSKLVTSSIISNLYSNLIY